MSNLNHSEHFSQDELACPCCDACNMDPQLLEGLERFRMLAALPVVIHSAYRCPKHNAAIGGVPTSLHLTGQAADLSIAKLNPLELYFLADTVPWFQTGGIGLYDYNFIHVDIRHERARWCKIHGVYRPLELFWRWMQNQRYQTTQQGEFTIA